MNKSIAWNAVQKGSRLPGVLSNKINYKYIFGWQKDMIPFIHNNWKVQRGNNV